MSGSQKREPINWEDYNYPPYIRLFHYSTDHLKQPILRIVRFMHLSFSLIIIVSLVNCKFLSALFQTDSLTQLLLLLSHF